VTTGNPVRPEVLAAAVADRDEARRRFGVAPGRRLVLVVGGSLGALRLNQAVVGALARWRDRDDLVVHHVVGRRDWEVVRDAVPPLDGAAVDYRPVEYEHDMATALRAADLAVARAGSGTCFELAAVGLPAILVPSPHVTGDHQTANARHLVDVGGAVVVPDGELDGDRLATEVDALLGDPARLAELARGVRTLARPDAADAVAALAESRARA
jgi:UDP-N-acetylglucosamine--N-acetylmuramyl-(pentapeptide) pyrophosphoryl-undecaprenol N-acetylglucosamine transferase